MQNSIQSDLEFGVEWRVLELLCLELDTAQNQEKLKTLVRTPDFSWGELLDQAIRHRMQYLLAYQLTKDEAFNLSMPRYMSYLLQDALKLNLYTMEILRTEVARVVEALQQARIPFVVNKGFALESTVYGGYGLRQLGDVDLMISPEYNDRTSEVLKNLGYVVGHYKRSRDALVVHPRRDMIIYKLNPDHLPKFVRMTNDRFVRVVNIHVANSLTWTSSDYVVELEVAFATIDSQPIIGHPAVALPVFLPEYFYLFLILHFFREAWLLTEDAWGQKDVNLIKCADILFFWQAHPELCDGRLRAVIQKHALAQPVLWVLEHIDRALCTHLVAPLQLDEHLSEEWLASASRSKKDWLHWNGSMRERLYRKQGCDFWR